MLETNPREIILRSEHRDHIDFGMKTHGLVRLVKSLGSKNKGRTVNARECCNDEEHRHRVDYTLFYGQKFGLVRQKND